MTTKTDTKLAWDEVGERLSSLGLKLKLHFEAKGADPAEVKGAVEKVTTAVSGAFEAVGAAADDDAVKADISEAAQSLARAIDTSLSECLHR